MSIVLKECNKGFLIYDDILNVVVGNIDLNLKINIENEKFKKPKIYNDILRKLPKTNLEQLIFDFRRSNPEYFEFRDNVYYLYGKKIASVIDGKLLFDTKKINFATKKGIIEDYLFNRNLFNFDYNQKDLIINYYFVINDIDLIKRYCDKNFNYNMQKMIFELILKNIPMHIIDAIIKFYEETLDISYIYLVVSEYMKNDFDIISCFKKYKENSHKFEFVEEKLSEEMLEEEYEEIFNNEIEKQEIEQQEYILERDYE